MSRIYDNWERLVEATLLREHLRYLSRIDSEASSLAPSFRLLSENSLNLQKLGYRFSYKQILQATGNFSKKNLIKPGHSGDIFRGSISNSIWNYFPRVSDSPGGGNSVVIKRVDLMQIDGEGYISELDFLSKIKHLGFVHLVGCCLEKENWKFLVYRYIPKRDLSSSFYFKSLDAKDLLSLDWITRMKIAIRAAEALSYLHEEFSPPLVHGDVQASSILLDDSFEVRLGSLSLAGADDGMIARTSEHDTLPVTCAFDVYCLGKVLLELVTGKLDISAPNDAITDNWLESELLSHISINDMELVVKIVDPSLIIDEDLLEELWAMAIVAKSCLNPNPQRRPQMRDILKALENPFELTRAEQTGPKNGAAAVSAESWAVAAVLSSLRHNSSEAADKADE